MRKVAIVTGASRGIGAATAILLGKSGYDVAVGYHKEKAKAQAVMDAIAKAGGKGIALGADLASEADILKFFKAVDSELGPVSALVNNAAINPRHGQGAVENMPREAVESVFATNVISVFSTCREALSRMKKAGGGSIVNVSSEAGRFGGKNMAHYAASKAAINTFTIAFAREAAAYSVRVNAVSPGVIDTGVHDAAIKTALPMERMGKPEEVAEAILWLLSDAAAYVSGAVLPVAGAR